MTAHEQLTPGDLRPARFPNGTPRVHRLEPAAIIAVTMLATSALLAVYGVVANLQQRSLLHRIQTSPASVTLGDIQTDSDRVHLVNTTTVVLVVLTGIAFIAWMFQAYRNVDLLGRPRRWAVGWAIGWWFVPFACLGAPLLVTHDVNGSLDDEHSAAWIRTRWLLNAWWSGWLLMLLLGLAAQDKDNAVHSFGDAFTANGLFVARNVVGVIAALLALAVVVRITRRTRSVTSPSPLVSGGSR